MMLKTQYYRSHVTILFLLVLVATQILGRAVPYTTFEGHSPFEGSQMEAIERLRLRGASEKEIFARFPHPMPVVATPEATGETASQWSGLLHSVLAKLGVNEEQQDGVIENIAGEMASEEGESGKRTVREVGQEMELRGEMVRDAEKRMLERSSEMITGVGEMMDVDESRDERNVGITGEDGEMAAVGEHAAHERAVDMVEDIHDMANTEHADSSTMEKRWFDDENAHTLGGNQQTSANMRTDLKTSTEISVRADTAIQKQGIDLDMENGGLEVRGQMGGLKAIHVSEA